MLVILPAHNEEASLPVVLRRLLRVPFPMEICVVDSLCTDETISLIQHYPVRILPAEQKGYAHALLCGYRYAEQCGAQTIVQLDADGQHPVPYVPHLAHGLSSVDWVIGSRHRTGSSGSMLRRTGAFVVNRMVSPPGLSDLSSGFWAFNAHTLAFFLKIFPVEHTEAPLRIRALAHGLRIAEQPLPMRDRERGNSMHRGFSAFRHGISMLQQSHKLKKKYLF